MAGYETGPFKPSMVPPEACLGHLGPLVGRLVAILETSQAILSRRMLELARTLQPFQRARAINELAS
eukprot:3118849-Pyramimonas_sp.AAC.1